jgi:hypothetical protein
MVKHQEKCKPDIVARVTAICGAILAVAGVVALCWGQLAEPRIDRKISAAITPIQDAVEYQCFLMMSKMTDDEIKAADRRYFAAKAAKGKFEKPDK